MTKTTTAETTQQPKTSRLSSKKKKHAYQDGGTGPREIELIRTVNRQLWQRSSLARKIVLKRCLLPDGHSKCESCGDIVIKVFVDHTEKLGEVDQGWLARLWVSSREMTGMCKRCHDIKTNCEKSWERIMSEWSEVDPNALIRATTIVVKQFKNENKRMTPKAYDDRMKIAYMEESKVSKEEVIPLDPDIMEMDLWTHQKIKLQEKRNENKKDFSMDDLIGIGLTPAPKTESIADLF